MDWQDARAKTDRQASALVDNDATLIAIVPLLAAAMRSAFEEDIPDDLVGQRLSYIIENCLNQNNREDLSSAFKKRRADRDHGEEETIAQVEIVIGRAIGIVVGSNPGEKEWRLSTWMQEEMNYGFKDFDSTAEKTIREVRGAVDLLVAVLQKRAAGFDASPRSLVSLSKFEEAAFRGQSRPDHFLNVWEEPPFSRMFLVRNLEAFELLRRIAPLVFIQMLEGLSNVEVARQIVSQTARNADIKDLCGLLAEATPVFDQNGEWIQSNTLAILLLAACTEKLSSNNQAASSKVDWSQLSETVREIMSVLSARLDFVSLGYAWLQYLVWSSHARGYWRHDTSDGDPPAPLWGILEQLASWLPVHSKPLQWVSAERQIWQNDRIYSVVIVAISKKPIDGSAIGDLLRSFAEHALLGSWSIEQLAIGGSLVERRAVGIAVSSISEPYQWFRITWERIFRLRDESRRHRFVRGEARPNIGAVVVYWALCGLNHLDLKSQAARKLWAEIEVSARESALTEGLSIPPDLWGTAALWLAAYWPRIFEEDISSGSFETLKDFVSNWSAPDKRFASLVLELKKNGVPTVGLRHALVSTAILRRGVEDARRANKIGQQANIAASVAELADEIDGLMPPSSVPC